MKQKNTPESNIYTTDKETTREKNEPGVSTIDQGTSLMKKNEFTMIIIAALVVTILVFFFFFRGSSTQNSSEPEAVSAKGEDPITPGFEDRISALEIALAKIASSSEQNEKQAASRVVSALDQRISRVETAVNLKLDSLIDRVDKFEGRLRKVAVVAPTPSPKPFLKPSPKPSLKSSPTPSPKPSPKTVVKSEPKVKTPAPAPRKEVQVAKTGKEVQVAKKKAEKPKKASQFHTVQKGETLWSISQKYKTNVEAVRKMNNLTPEDKIHIGGKLLVR